MNSIDLVKFADHSQKLPSSFLQPVNEKNDFKLWKVFLTHYLDFSAVFVSTAIMASVFNQSLKTLLVSRLLQKAWSDEVIMTFSASMLPFMVFSYFFFSFFLNHGQTWGMFLMKKRIDMKSQSFKEAALWACYSMVLCFTGGLSYLIKKDKWQSYRPHDYLYDNLMVERQLAPMNLLSEIDKFQTEVPHEEEEWSQAA